jgi:predicted nucleic acid-binding Zn ribbon protein
MKYWQCALCHTLIPDGATICRGCGGHVSYKKERQIARAIIFCLFGALGFFHSVLLGICGCVLGILLAFLIPISKDPKISYPYRN